MLPIDTIIGSTTVSVLVPAYGRIYSSKEEVLKDWKDGKDFQSRKCGWYCSIRDLEELKKYYDSVYIEWKPVTETIAKILKII